MTEEQPSIGANAIFHHFGALVAGEVEDNFNRFVQRYRVEKWLIAADFVMGDRNRFNDAIAITVYPHLYEIRLFLAMVRSSVPRDIKKEKEISQQTLHYMAKADHFTFCIAVGKSRGRRWVNNKDQAQGVIKTSINMMRAWQDADKHIGYIKKAEALFEKAKSNSFNTHLTGDRIIVTACIGYVIYMLIKSCNPELIGCFSTEMPFLEEIIISPLIWS